MTYKLISWPKWSKKPHPPPPSPLTPPKKKEAERERKDATGGHKRLACRHLKQGQPPRFIAPQKTRPFELYFEGTHAHTSVKTLFTNLVITD